jgi:hypothetical protein
MTKTETIIGDIYDAWRAQDIEWLGTYLRRSGLAIWRVATRAVSLESESGGIPKACEC